MPEITPMDVVTGKGAPDLMAAVEAKLREAEQLLLSGEVEWTDADEALLAAWRWARGEAGMGQKWEWWSMGVGNNEYEFAGGSRDEVLAMAREVYPTTAIMITEARYWSDDIRAECGRFAQMRNQEMVQPEGRANG